MFKRNKTQQLRKVLFETDSNIGHTFDIFLLVLIIFSVLTVILESVESYSIKYRSLFISLEFFFTLIFTCEYILRLISARSARRYAFSYYGLVDLMALLPTYLSFFFVGSGSLLVVRSLRILRVFRIFKLTKYLSQGNQIVEALKSSKPKITVFLIFVVLIATIIGSIMYLVEARSNPDFDSIPRSIYWAIVTLTTVGYGDISPHSPLGQGLASLVMILGYSVIAVPTGIITNELGLQSKKQASKTACPSCKAHGHEQDAQFCKHCGNLLKKK